MELTKEQFFDWVDKFENNHNCSAIRIGDYEGETFAIFDSWETVEGFSAFINGFSGLKGSKPYLRYGETLHNKYLEIKAESEANPDHWELKRKVEETLSHLLYSQYLASNSIEPISIDDFGIEWGFSDEYDTCCHCGAVVRISPDSYNWTAPLFVDCEGYACDQCCESGQFDDYVLDSYRNKQKSIPDSFDLDRLGLVRINDETLESGWYGGQCDTPEPIIEALNAANIDVWFKVYPRQFDLSFDVYVESDNEERAKEILSGTDTRAKEDPAELLKRGLQAASNELSKLNGEGIKYSKINADGTASARLVSKEEFIKGIKD